MAYKTSLNYSPNFSSKKRKQNQIKFIIFHYTGMKNEKAAIKRLTDIRSEVSCNYFIKKDVSLSMSVNYIDNTRYEKMITFMGEFRAYL